MPCFFTRFELAADGSDIGVYGRKRKLLDSENRCLAGTRGAELVPRLQPGPHDIVCVKKKPSAFHGTPLLGYLVQRQVDTVIVLGGATSNCVRHTVFDASSFNFRGWVRRGRARGAAGGVRGQKLHPPDALARGVGAFVVDGKLVDGPFITRAERLVALARRLGLVA